MLLDDFSKILSGLPLSLGLTLSGALIGLMIAIMLTCLLSYFPKGITRFCIQSYLILFTGTPLLVQIFLIYYGPGQFTWLKNSFLWDILSHAWVCAIIALALNSAAYTTQLFYGAMKAIPKGLYEGCEALGMTRFQTLCILLPLALRRALPSYSNELILVFKSTSLVYTITLMDIIGYTQAKIAETYNALPYYCMAGVIYLCVNVIMISLLRRLEKNALRFEG